MWSTSIKPHNFDPYFQSVTKCDWPIDVDIWHLNLNPGDVLSLSIKPCSLVWVTHLNSSYVAHCCPVILSHQSHINASSSLAVSLAPDMRTYVVLVCSFSLVLSCLPPPPAPAPAPAPAPTPAPAPAPAPAPTGSCKCGEVKVSRTRIVGGQAVERYEYPWQVSYHYIPVPQRGEQCSYLEKIATFFFI